MKLLVSNLNVSEVLLSNSFKVRIFLRVKLFWMNQNLLLKNCSGNFSSLSQTQLVVASVLIFVAQS